MAQDASRQERRQAITFRGGPRSEDSSRLLDAKVLLVLAAALSAGADALAANDITVISFGRADQAALTQAYYGAFRKSTGIGVKSASYDGETTELEQMVGTRSGMPPIIGYDWNGKPIRKDWYVPCAGSGPMNLGSLHPAYKDCSKPDLRQAAREPWLEPVK